MNPSRRKIRHAQLRVHPSGMTPLFNILAPIVLSAFVLTSCESNNEKARNKVKELVDSVTPKAILEASSELDQKTPEQEGTLIPLGALPASFSAFEPLEVLYRFQGSYLIVVDKWVQHRTGLFIAAPNEIIPASTEHQSDEKLGNRLYFYQD